MFIHGSIVQFTDYHIPPRVASKASVWTYQKATKVSIYAVISEIYKENLVEITYYCSYLERIKTKTFSTHPQFTVLKYIAPKSELMYNLFLDFEWDWN